MHFSFKETIILINTSQYTIYTRIEKWKTTVPLNLRYMFQQRIFFTMWDKES